MTFQSFWTLYPRKVSRKMAEKAWSKLSTAEQAQALEALPAHIRYWNAADTAKEFIPYASSWLNQARYDDELEMPQQKQATLAWWTTDAGVMAKGSELGLSPRPGEAMSQFKSRVADSIRRVA